MTTERANDPRTTGDGRRRGWPRSAGEPTSAPTVKGGGGAGQVGRANQPLHQGGRVAAGLAKVGGRTNLSTKGEGCGGGNGRWSADNPSTKGEEVGAGG